MSPTGSHNDCQNNLPPDTQNKKSLFTLNKIQDTTTGCERQEDLTEMCCRLIYIKTGVLVPLQDISACHPLSKKSGSTSYIIRISNRKPGSAWDILAAGLLTGKNKATQTNFTDSNVYINFQLTKKRNELSKAIRDAKKARKVAKYGCDQNGRFTIKAKSDSKWQEVKSIKELEDIHTQVKYPV